MLNIDIIQAVGSIIFANFIMSINLMENINNGNKVIEQISNILLAVDGI